MVVTAIALLAILTTATAQTATDKYLDLYNYATVDMAGWNTDKIDHIYQNTVRSTNLWVTMSVYGLVYGEGSNNWLDYSNETTTDMTWTIVNGDGFFLGSSAYFSSTTARAFGSNTSTERVVSVYVTNITGVRIGGYQHNKSACTMEIYECSKNTDGSLNVGNKITTIQSKAYTNSKINLGETSLNQKEIYKVTCKIKNGYMYEFAFIVPLPEPSNIKATIGDAQLSTFYSPYPVVIPDDENLLNVMYPSEISGKTLILKKITTDIPANTPVILFGNPGTYQFPINTGTVTPLANNNLLSGSNQNITCAKALNLAGKSGTNAFVMTLGHGGKNGFVGFYRYLGTSLAANKAYLIYDPDANNNNVSFLSLNGDGDENSDGIRDMKALNNDDAWYTLQGTRLYGEPSQRGIYIHGGKKVTVK